MVGAVGGEDGWRESAVGKLLRAAGVEPRARRDDLEKMTIREAERKTGVSRQTLHTWLRDLAPGERRQYDAKRLDMVAEGLKISRRELGVAAMLDAGQVLAGSGEDAEQTLRQVYDYLSNRTIDEQTQLMAWLAQRIAEKRAKE